MIYYYKQGNIGDVIYVKKNFKINLHFIARNVIMMPVLIVLLKINLINLKFVFNLMYEI